MRFDPRPDEEERVESPGSAKACAPPRRARRGRSANHAAHTHGEEEILYVFEGTAKFTLNGESKIVGPNSTLFCPAGVSHGIFFAGDTPLRYAVIKSNYPASDE